MMIDSIGRGAVPPSRLDRAAGPVRPDRPGPAAAAPQPARAGSLARDLAASPPVDAARVAALKASIADGTFRVDPMKIAERMLALEPGRR